jgi:hypothetical protein
MLLVSSGIVRILMVSSRQHDHYPPPTLILLDATLLSCAAIAFISSYGKVAYPLMETHFA